MSYDRIWLCRSLKSEDWIEPNSQSRRHVSTGEIFPDEMIQRELLAYEDRDHHEWEFAVTLSMGDVCTDEMYLFLKERDARRFFQGGPLAAGEQGYLDREFIYEDASHGCDVGYGFDSVELWIKGELVAEHSGPALGGRRYEHNSLNLTS